MAVARGPERFRARAADADLVLGSTAGVVQPLRGINIGPLGNLTNPSLTAAYQQRGVNLIRTHDFYGPLDMATMYPDRSRNPLLASSFNFAGIVGDEFRSSDDTFRAIVNGGFEPFLRLGDSYNDAAPPTAGQRANWEQAGLQVIRHYRDGQWGGFTSNRYVEIWNEPDNQTFWPLPFTRTDRCAAGGSHDPRVERDERQSLPRGRDLRRVRPYGGRHVVARAVSTRLYAVKPVRTWVAPSGRIGAMPYPELFVAPMRQELTGLGFEELRTSEEVDAAVKNTGGTLMIVVNSVCGCAAGKARPGIALALRHDVRPDRIATVFAGADVEATDRARGYFTGYPPSSPAIGILRGGQLVFMLERSQIENRTAEQIAGVLTSAFDTVCARTTT